MWKDVAPGGVVGAMWPDDPDGNAWSDPNVGFPPALAAAGYTLVDPGRFPLGTTDYTAQISQFKDAGVEIVTGVMIPPDFGAFWTQCQQQGFQPKAVTVGKCLLFPSAVASYPNPIGLSSEIWWSDRHPTTSSLTGQTSAELAAAYEAATGRQWTQPVGYVHSLFEVAIDALKRAGGAERQAGAARRDGRRPTSRRSPARSTSPTRSSRTSPRRRSSAANGWRARSGTSSSRSSPTRSCPQSRSTARWSRSPTDVPGDRRAG